MMSPTAGEQRCRVSLAAYEVSYRLHARLEHMRGQFCGTKLIFRHPSIPDGVTLRSGFVEAMPRRNPRVVKLHAIWWRLVQRIPFPVRLLGIKGVVPHLGKDVNFEVGETKAAQLSTWVLPQAFCSAFAERQVVFVLLPEHWSS